MISVALCSLLFLFQRNHVKDYKENGNFLETNVATRKISTTKQITKM
jgi:hypothetical protein